MKISHFLNNWFVYNDFYIVMFWIFTKKIDEWFGKWLKLWWTIPRQFHTTCIHRAKCWNHNRVFNESINLLTQQTQAPIGKIKKSSFFQRTQTWPISDSSDSSAKCVNCGLKDDVWITFFEIEKYLMSWCHALRISVTKDVSPSE